MTACLKKYESTDLRPGTKPRMVDIVSRNARFDVEEAKAKSELRKLDRNPDLFPGSTDTMRQALETQLEGISACRKIGTIKDILGTFYESQVEALESAAIAGKEIVGMKADASALENQISDIRARDVREDLDKAVYLENEMEFVNRVLSNGTWTKTSLDKRIEAFRYDLGNLEAQGIYNGELTEDAAINRVKEIETQLSNIREKPELSAAEINKLAMLESELDKIKKSITEKTPGVKAIIARSEETVEKFKDLLDASEISIYSILEIFKINSGMLMNSMEAPTP